MSGKIPTPDELQFGSIVTKIEQPDGTIRHEKEVVYNGETATFQVDLSKSFDIDRKTLMHHIMEAIAHISNGETRRIDLTIIANANHEPTRMEKKWVILVDKVSRK